MKKVSVVLPAYLEAENLRTILPILKSTLSGIDYEIIIVDTMMPMDDTREVCEKYDVVYIPRTGGNSYGDAIRTGFCTAQGYYIVVMDADGSHDPKYILDFYNEAENGNYDLVIGSRYCKGGNTDNPFLLQCMSGLLNMVFRLLFGIKVKDVSDSFRLYRADQIKNLVLECDNFDIVEEILIKLCMNYTSFHIKEYPIVFKKRCAGESKRELITFIKSYLNTIWKLLKVKKAYK